MNEQNSIHGCADGAHVQFQILSPTITQSLCMSDIKEFQSNGWIQYISHNSHSEYKKKLFFIVGVSYQQSKYF